MDTTSRFPRLQFIFFPEQPFYGYYWTLDSHTNTVISHAFAYLSRWRRKPLQGLLFRSRTAEFCKLIINYTSI